MAVPVLVKMRLDCSDFFNGIGRQVFKSLIVTANFGLKHFVGCSSSVDVLSDIA